MKRASLGAAVAAAALLLSATEAVACLNAVEIKRKQAIELIAEAEKLLAGGESQKALEMLNGKLGGAEGYEISSAKLGQKLERLWAVARMRAGGTGDIEDAVEVLRDQLKESAKDPWLKVRLAEALSRTKGGTKEARSLLEPLAKQDLIVDPEGFATLARLRKQAKDEAGTTAALERCKAMAKDAALCSAEPLPPPKKTPRRAVDREET